MSAQQTLAVTILSCGGMADLMSEQEAVFLNSALPLFRNVVELGRATPRANPSMVRAFNPAHFYEALSGSHDVLHLIAHADSSRLQVGRTHIAATDVAARARRGLRMPKVVVSTACKFSGTAWRSTLRALGVEVLIGSGESITPANLTAFDMAFYSALLSQVRKGSSTVERVVASFEIADDYYRRLHARGTPYAKFHLTRL